MPQEPPPKETRKPKQRFNGRRDYVDSFRWGFVSEAGSSNAASPPSASAEVVASDPSPKSKQSRPQKKSAIKPQAAPKEKTSEKQSSKTSAAPPAKQSPQKQNSEKQPVPGKRPPKKKKRSKAVLPQYVDNSNYEDDEDLRLPSYGRTPIPTDDELPVPRKKIAEKQNGGRKSASEAPKPAGEIPVVSDVPTGIRPRREQMVWDPDRSEYVPLVITQKPESCAPKKPTKRASQVKMQERDDVSPPVSSSQRPTDGLTLPAPTPQKKSFDKDTGGLTPPAPKQTDEPKKHPPRRGDVPKFVDTSRPDPTDTESEVSGFAELGVSETMLEALKIVRYLEPTPIQAGVFQKVAAGVDLMGQARTGTGKTAAFSMPIIEGVETCPPGNNPVALILVPTRELAVQVRDEAMRLAYGRDIRIAACYGGKPLAKQIERLKNGIDILVGTPGRLLDLMNRRALSLDALRWVVLDEADRMLDIGFRPDIEKILKRTPSDRQTLLFSATLPPPVVRLAERFMKSPEVMDFSNKNVAVDTIDQYYVTVDPERKFDALVYLLEEQQPKQAIIFTRTKRGADRLARLLSKRFDKLAAIHGDLQQNERDSVMAKVRAGSLRYLVATDVVGRGIDVTGISHIINYDIPKFCDDYVHRVGRTGRMGREGVAFTFVTVQEGSELTRIEMRIDKLLKRAELKGFESFTKPHDPNASLDDDDLPEPPKPVFGKPVRKVRRAL